MRVNFIQMRFVLNVGNNEEKSFLSNIYVLHEYLHNKSEKTFFPHHSLLCLKKKINSKRLPSYENEICTQQ